MARLSKTAQQRGHDFQQDVQDCLRGFERKRKTVTLRLYDTKSAGNYLPAQPGDFVSVCYGKAILIEAKSSAKHLTLSGKRAPLTSLFDPEQIAKMRLWKRAGAKVWVIFQSQEHRTVEVWKGDYIAECFVTPRQCAEFSQAYIFPKESNSHNNIEEACKFMLDIS